MVDPKKIAYPAGLGFGLSFLISLISTHNIGRAFLRAIAFGILFALLYFAIDFFATKFLSDTQVLTETDTNQTNKKSMQKNGSRIDFTIGDEELTDDGQELKFVVSKNKHQLKPLAEEQHKNTITNPVSPAQAEPSNSISESSKSQEPSTSVSKQDKAESGNVVSSKKVETTSETKEFKPIKLGVPVEAEANVTNAKETAKTEAPIPAEKENAPVKEMSKKQLAKESEKAEIDELPELSDFMTEDGESSGEIIEDSDFARSGMEEPAIHGLHKVGTTDMTKLSTSDAPTMAKAIQTILKRDEA